MKKIVGFICAAAVAACCAFSFTGCGTAEVVYKISDDGTYYILSGVSGNVGALKECVIASSYDDGEHGELPVTQIGDKAFMGCTSLTKVSIPDGLTQIGSLAFAYTRLREVVFPDSLTYIGVSAFGSCNSLKSVEIPSSVTVIGPNAFAFCSSLESVIVNAQVTRLYYSTFEGTYTLTESSVYSDSALTEITLPATIEKIDITALRFNPIQDIYYGGTTAEWEEVKFIYYTTQASEDDPSETQTVEVALSKEEVASYMNYSYNGSLSSYILSTLVTVHCSDGDIVYSEGEVSKSA